MPVECPSFQVVLMGTVASTRTFQYCAVPRSGLRDRTQRRNDEMMALISDASVAGDHSVRRLGLVTNRSTPSLTPLPFGCRRNDTNTRDPMGDVARPGRGVSGAADEHEPDEHAPDEHAGGPPAGNCSQRRRI
jgi:hypothetical protein